MAISDVLTPNIPEAERIADMHIHSVKDMEIAARKIYAMGCGAVVVKGGHAVSMRMTSYLTGRKCIIL